MLHDYLISLIRTAVPAAVGVVLTWLAMRFGIVLDNDVSAQLAAGAAALVIAAYYAIVRGLETRWPWFGKLLGRKAAPTYVEPREASALRSYRGR